MAKCMFEDKGLQLYNRLSTLWFVLYFFLLRYLQTFGLSGVFVASTIFFLVRMLIALYAARVSEPRVRIGSTLWMFSPKLSEAAGYLCMLVATRYVTQTAAQRNKHLAGLGVCVLAAFVHFGAVVFF